MRTALLLLQMSSPALPPSQPSPHELLMDELDWDVHPRIVQGDIRVLPAIVICEAPELHRTGLLGETVDPWVRMEREARTAELAALPVALRDAVPGALFAEMPEAWSGTFRDAPMSPGVRRQLQHAIGGEGSLELALAEAGRAAGGDAALVVWVVQSSGEPLTASHMVGEMVLTNEVPVMVDHVDEPYQVRVEAGMALVASDGEVLFRYQDTYDGVLTGDSPLRVTARDLARSMVGDIAPMWLDSPEAPVAPPVLAEL